MKAILLSSVVLLTSWFAAPVAWAVPCVVLTDDNKIINFDSASPNTAGAAIAVTGLGAGFNLVGIDVRTTVQTVGAANPGVGTLWALAINGVTARIYVINPTTGAATQVGGDLTGIDGSGSGPNGWFFGHNPGTDRFRMMNFQKNYELNPNTVTFVQQTNIDFFPNSNGSAFETASFGQSSRIFFVDQNPNDSLRTSNNITSGVTSVVGDTSLSFSVGAGLDIAGGTTLLAAKVGVANLYNVNRSTGVATLINVINGNPNLRALAIRPASFPPKLPVTLKVLGKRKIETPLPAITIRGTAACKAGIRLVDFRVGKAKARKAKGKARWSARILLKPGSNVVTFRATGNNLIKSKPAKVTILRE